jgi:pyridoxal phosphate enzyme (YggS family)
MIRERLREIKERMADAAIRSGREPEDVRLLGATKFVPAERIINAISSGLLLFGENYVQEAKKKLIDIGRLRKETKWHFIGHLQRNKARLAVEFFDCIETVDNLKLLSAINKCAMERDVIFQVLIQVNLSKEPQKSGMFPEDVFSFLNKAREFENVGIKGLMTMPPYSDNPEDSRKWFRLLMDLKNRANDAASNAFVLKELSMGMSHDFEVAIEEGATIVRVGTALFGQRKEQ